MTHTPVRWANVLFGVGLTILVAAAPMVFVFLTGQSAQAREQSASGDNKSASLLEGGFNLPDNQAVLVLIASVAVAALAAVIFVSTRAERSR